MTQLEFLKEVMKKLDKSKAYQLAVEFDIPDNVMYDYFKNKRVLDDYACFKVAETLEIDPAYVIAKIKAESEKNEKKREYFRSFGGTSRKIAANIIALALVSFILVGGQGLGIGSFNFNAVGRYKRKPNFV